MKRVQKGERIVITKNGVPVTVLSGFGSSADLEKVIFQLPIIIEAEPLVRVFDGIVQLARKYDLSTYDAAYLDLAMRIGLPLTTQDDKLRRVALLCGVEFFKNF